MHKKYETWLRKHGLKVTKNRLLMLRILDQEHDFLSADDLYLKIKAMDRDLSLSTVYRSMESLVDAGIVSTVNLDTSKQTLYELSHTEHAHHLICMSCHKIIHVHECPMGSFEDKIAKAHQFDVTDHKLELYGYCSECKAE